LIYKASSFLARLLDSTPHLYTLLPLIAKHHVVDTFLPPSRAFISQLAVVNSSKAFGCDTKKHPLRSQCSRRSRILVTAVLPVFTCARHACTPIAAG
jgi:hypothetical protein